MAAPVHTAYLGWASTATGRPKADDTSSATSGVRDEPPTSSTAVMPWGSTSADRRARFMAVIESVSAGRTIASYSDRVRRTSVCRPGSSTGIDTSVSLESASLASTHSWRSRATAAWAAGSSGSSSSRAGLMAVATWWNTAWSKSTPPSRSMPSGEPRISQPSPVLRSTAASNVPPPRS